MGYVWKRVGRRGAALFLHPGATWDGRFPSALQVCYFIFHLAQLFRLWGFLQARFPSKSLVGKSSKQTSKQKPTKPQKWKKWILEKLIQSSKTKSEKGSYYRCKRRHFIIQFSFPFALHCRAETDRGGCRALLLLADRPSLVVLRGWELSYLRTAQLKQHGLLEVIKSALEKPCISSHYIPIWVATYKLITLFCYECMRLSVCGLFLSLLFHHKPKLP